MKDENSHDTYFMLGTTSKKTLQSKSVTRFKTPTAVTIKLKPHYFLPSDTVWSGSFPKFRINFLPPSSRCLLKKETVKPTVSSVSNFYK
jgi:hypothetical protein